MILTLAVSGYRSIRNLVLPLERLNVITGANGISVPFAEQAVQGFSGIIPGPVTGTFDFIIDNGFGAKANSADSLLRVLALRPNFASGKVTPYSSWAVCRISTGVPGSWPPKSLEGTPMIISPRSW